MSSSSKPCATSPVAQGKQIKGIVICDGIYLLQWGRYYMKKKSSKYNSEKGGKRDRELRNQQYLEVERVNYFQTSNIFQKKKKTNLKVFQEKNIRHVINTKYRRCPFRLILWFWITTSNPFLWSQGRMCRQGIIIYFVGEDFHFY